MAKELPYFKFFPAEWDKGNITICSYEAQGVFINICAFYWMKDCSISTAFAMQKLHTSDAILKELQNNGIISIDDEDMIHINFLDEQMSEFNDISKKRSKAAASRFKQVQCKSNAKAMQKVCYKDKDKDKEKNSLAKKCLMKNSGITIEHISDAFEKTDDLKNANPKYYFNAALDWSESKGEMRKDWIATVRTFARKDLADGKLRLRNSVKTVTNIAPSVPKDYGVPSPTAQPMPEGFRKRIHSIGKE